MLNAGAAQTLSVTFTPTDAANYTTATASRSLITVLKATPVITWPTPGGHRLRHGAERDAAERDGDACPARFVYTPAAGTVLNAGAAQTLSVTFTPTDAANYTTATQDGAINVAEGDAGHHLADAGGHRLRHGAERDAAERDGRRVAGTLRLHAGGRRVLLNAGAAQTLSVTFTPTDAANYTTATASVRSTCSKATPVITWPTPADIVYGTALSATQLNATTTVPGTFVYTPAAGTVLNAGARRRCR